MAEVHSTASEGAVSRVNKFGNDMPILRPIKIDGVAVPHYYNVTEGSIHKGRIQKRPDNTWWADPNWATAEKINPGPHVHRHQAVGALYGLDHQVSDVAEREHMV